MLKPSLLFLLIITSATLCQAARVDYQMDCDLGKGATQTREANGYTVVLTPTEGVCRVSILDANKQQLFRFGSTGIQVYVGVGVTTDGGPNAIIQEDTIHPYKLFIVSLGEHPRLVKVLENLYGFWLQDDCGGRIRIWTSDGGFQKDPDLNQVYHGLLFAPDVVFEIEGERLVDATPVCRVYFDEEIKSYRSKLSQSKIQKFRTNRISDDFQRGEVTGKVLKIVFWYLYTGREAEAKQVLQQMWPKNDIDRIWQSILRERSEGVLKNIIQVH